MISDAQRLILDHLDKESNRLTDIQSAEWLYKPVSLELFVQDFLGLPPLTTRQKKEIEMVLGSDPTKVLDEGSPYNVGVFLLGKGSGKDYMASVFISYIMYLLLCLRDPHAYVGFPKGEPIDIVIVAYSGSQTELTTFDKIRHRFLNWAWLKQNYTLIDDDKYVSPKGKQVIQMYKGMIRTWHNIRITSQHSQNESYEGLNIVAWIMSEASAFKTRTNERNGHKVFSTLRSSASSRFGKRWKGMVISFPRYDQETDFTWKLYKAALDKQAPDSGIDLSDCTIWPVLGYTWEFRPWQVGSRVVYCGRTFTFDGVEIPIELKADFDEDPDESRMKFMCQVPPGGAQTFGVETIIKGMKTHRQPLFKYTEVIEGKDVRVVLDPVYKNKTIYQHNYLITVDLGRTFSAAAISLQHVEGGIYVQDVMITWTPVPKLQAAVDLLDVKRVLIDLLKTIPQVRIAFDQWQSDLFKAELGELDMEAGTYHTYVHDYSNLRKGILLGQVELLDDPQLAIQLSALRELGDEVYLDKTISERKDRVDVVAGGFKILISEEKDTNLPGTIISSNLKQFGQVIR